MLSVILSTLVLTLCGTPTLAQNTTIELENGGPSTFQKPGPCDPVELEVFFDNLIPAQLERYHIPGATVSFVKDGELLFSKGYGFSEIDEEKPVLANKTLFRIGSVSKLFIWVAVMQLSEQGKLDLDSDVNTYLETFQIPNTYPQPITLKHLMTHTAGFEERVVGMWAESATDLLAIDEFLFQNMPARVRPPGTLSSYSNYGAALSGCIVEQVSKKPFDQYVEENIFKPLKMKNSSFKQPLPPELEADISSGYTYENGVYQKEPFDYIKGSPAGSMSATSEDMAKFMIAHLQDGCYEDGQILKNHTVQKMHSQIFSHDPKVSGWTYGFAESNLNGQRIIMHSGSMLWQKHHSLLVLIPEQNVGLFVAYNSDGGKQARTQLLQAFLNRYYPSPTKTPTINQTIYNFDKRAGQLEGSFRMTRRAYTTFEKVTSAFTQVDLTANLNGTLLMTGLGDPILWVEVEPLFFIPKKGEPSFFGGLVFHEDDQGKINQFFLMNAPSFAFERVSWYETALFTRVLLIICIELFLSAVMLWTFSFFINRRKETKEASYPISLPRMARFLTGGITTSNMVFYSGLIILLNSDEIYFGVPKILVFFLVIALLTAALALVSTAFMFLSWKRGFWNFFWRVHYTIVTLASLVFIWWLNNWNLLGFRF